MSENNAKEYADFVKKKCPERTFTIQEVPTEICIVLADVVYKEKVLPRICTPNNFFVQFGPPELRDDHLSGYCVGSRFREGPR